MRPSGWSDRTLHTVYSSDAFTRLDEEEDRVFYAVDRLVNHLDNLALATVEKLAGALIVEREPAILDLMASWDSHVPAELNPARLVGLGMNARELAANPRLDQSLVHDLNRQPTLPLSDASFDAVVCTVSVDYLVQPFAVFAEVARVLRPGGLFLTVFSNRMFTSKAIKLWREASEAERILIVEDYFQATSDFGESRLWVSQGKPRPRCDKYADRGLPSDPIYAVWAEKVGGALDRPERVPPPAVARQPWDEASVAERKTSVGATHVCPYCEKPLSKWAVPENPFTEWDTPYFWICFNDRCPFLIHGWDAMNSQGNRGFSYRFRYDPDRDGCGSIPVPSLGALKASIVVE